MQKTIKINSNKSIKLDNNISWALIYRNQFGHDIIPDLMPILSAGFDIVGGVYGRAETLENAADLFKAIDKDEIEDALITLSGLEFTTFVNVCWAMAKCADDEIPEPMEWVKEFPSFPMDIIAPELVRLIIKGLVSSKNLKRLTEKLPTVQPTK